MSNGCRSNDLTGNDVLGVRGEPTPEELAAVIAVLRSPDRTGTHSPHPTAPPSAWTRSGRPDAVTGGGLPAGRGPGAWRAATSPGQR